MLFLGKLLKDCAIYKIENLQNGKFYIGSTNNAYIRFYSHQTNLRGGNHSSVRLQRAFNKYGEDSFVFMVLEYPKTDSTRQLREIEQTYIDNLIPEYNVRRDVFQPPQVEWNSERRKKASDSQKSSKIKPTESYIETMSAKIKSLWDDTTYRSNMLTSMRSPEALEKHSIASSEVWKRDGMAKKVYDAKMESTRQRGYTQNGLPVLDVYKIRELYESGMKPRKISEFYPNLSFRMIQKIAYRQIWKEL